MRVRYDLLNKLADFLDTLPRSHFDFSIVRKETRRPTKANTCGTVGCAIGWCPTVFPRLCTAPVSYTDEWIAKGYKIDMWAGGHAEMGRRLFGISNDDAYLLFTPLEPSPADQDMLGSSATPKQVAKRIRTYIAWRKKNRRA